MNALFLGGNMKIVLENLVENYNLYMAHHEGDRKETLTEHLDLTYKYYKKIKDDNNMNEIMENIFDNIIPRELDVKSIKEKSIDLFEEAIYLHDWGKINTNFQIEKMKNFKFGKDVNGTSNHSIISSVLYLEYMIDKYFNDEGLDGKSKIFLLKLAYDFSYIISRHHGYLRDKNSYTKELIDTIKNLGKQKHIIKDYLDKQRIFESDLEKLENILIHLSQHSIDNNVDYFIITKLLYSFIVACDFYATSEFMSNSKIEKFGYIQNVKDFTKKYYQDKIIKSIHEEGNKKNSKKSINFLRTEMFLEAERNFLENINEEIFYLEAPTGSGKTLTSINLATKVIENDERINKIFYVFPFNTLMDQTFKVLSDLFDEKDIGLINSLSPIKVYPKEKEEYEKEEYEDYNKSHLKRIMMDYPITLTSHVKFFSNLTGVGRESNLPLAHLANSVVIIDEIQSYKNIIWKELTILLQRYSKLLNIKFIIMSATLPKLSNLTGDKSYVSLIKDTDKYFKSKLFKKRVKLDYSLLKNGKINNEILENHLIKKVIKKEKTRILIEFIDKISAREFYKSIKNNSEFESYDIEELTGDDNAIFREDVISKLKEKDDDGNFVWKKVIIVATQVIEAGVDIDMDIGYKDISIIDSEEQFVGRINRSCLRKGAIAYFFDIFDEKKIYKNDIRINFSLRDVENRTYFDEKNFEVYFEKVMNRLDEEKNRANKNSIQIFKDRINNLEYLDLYNELKLIDQENYTIFIPQKLEYKGILYDGQEIWNKYKDIFMNFEIPYTKKQVELSNIKRELSYFTYNVLEKPRTWNDSLGELYYISDGEKYFDENKFDRRKYMEFNRCEKSGIEGMIL